MEHVIRTCREHCEAKLHIEHHRLDTVLFKALLLAYIILRYLISSRRVVFHGSMLVIPVSDFVIVQHSTTD